MILKILISIFALGLAVIHSYMPGITIDTTSLVLIVIALVPWLTHLLKSMELPGGIKFEFKDLQNATNRAKEAGLISDDLSESDEEKYSFQLIATDDPVLALAGLRIEIEKRLKHLAAKHNIGTKMQGIGSQISNLRNQQIISNQQYFVLTDMIGTLNQAVHAEQIDSRVADWAIDYGPKILKALDETIGNH